MHENIKMEYINTQAVWQGFVFYSIIPVLIV